MRIPNPRPILALFGIPVGRFDLIDEGVGATKDEEFDLDVLTFDDNGGVSDVGDSGGVSDVGGSDGISNVGDVVLAGNDDIELVGVETVGSEDV